MCEVEVLGLGWGKPEKSKGVRSWEQKQESEEEDGSVNLVEEMSSVKVY